MTVDRRVVVLGHDASRTGAPMLLLDLLRWVTQNETQAVDVILRRGGPLLAPMRRLARVRALRPAGRRGPLDVVEAILAETVGSGAAERVPGLEARRAGRLRLGPDDLVVVNGMGGAALLDAVPEGPQVSLLLHELDVGVDRSASDRRQRRLWERTDRIVAVSQAAADAVSARPGVDPDRVVVAHGFVPEAPAPTGTPAEHRRGLGVSDPDRPLIGSVSTGQWRKGTDLFVRLAARILQGGGPGPRLTWVGPVPPELSVQVRHDLREAGLADDVTLVGAVESTAPWFSACDVVVSTAREDPFPLVGMEAGLAARPMVSFDNGGLRELLADGCGVIVPPLDVAAMDREIRSLLDDPTRQARMGQAVRERVLDRHITEVGAPRLWRALRGDGQRRP